MPPPLLAQASPPLPVPAPLHPSFFRSPVSRPLTSRAGREPKWWSSLREERRSLPVLLLDEDAGDPCGGRRLIFAGAAPSPDPRTGCALLFLRQIRAVQMEKPTKVVAKWDPFAVKIFNDIFVKEHLAHNRPQHCLNGVGYANLVRKFYERTKGPYNEGQMKNRWDILNKKYTQWKTLNLRSTGLGRDPSTGCIVADNDWWEEQNAAMPGCICFRDAPLEHEDQMRIMFEAVIVTNETSYVPTRGVNNVQNLSSDAEGDGNGEIGATPHIPASTDGNLKRPAPLSPKGKKKKTFRDQCMKRLVEAYEMKAQSSKHSATSQVVDHVRDEIEYVGSSHQ
ncbi:hypothetical protein PR202_ga11186 [Eleusine coracana subsp. coracana]|uniref:Myb/SANT-like domain-containing protein n=1 Tax=Eleusine coracana subsp. coracana TaxID=191504 RepID=A0AAV5C8U1_ELECO|nr:hypothetical protein PR202_ga11186 [Eleusine coracana subsp. coracana]